MTPEFETLTRWEVRDMIFRAIAEYDIKQDMRHVENSKKLDKLIYLIIGTLLTVIGGIFTEVVMHAMGGK